MLASIKQIIHSTPNMTGQLFHRTTEVILRRPWKSKSPFASRPIQIIKAQGRKGCARGTTRYFLHSFPSCSLPVVQRYLSPIHLSELMTTTTTHTEPICIISWAFRERERATKAHQVFTHELRPLPFNTALSRGHISGMISLAVKIWRKRGFVPRRSYVCTRG